MSIKQIIYGAVDVGNGHVKIKLQNNLEFTLPSYCVLAGNYPFETLNPNEEEIETTKMAKFKYLNEENGALYAWGDDLKKGRPPYFHSFSQSDRYLTPEFKRMFAFAVARAIKNKSGSFELRLVSGLPSEEIAPKGEPLKQVQADFLNAVENDGKPHIVEIHEKSAKGNFIPNQKEITVKIINLMAQPIGTLWNKVLKLNGAIGEGRFLKEKIMIVDIGSGTTCIDLLDSASILDKHSPKLGMRYAYNQIAKAVKAENEKLSPTIEVIEQQINDDAYIESNLKRLTTESYQKIVKRELQLHAEAIMSYIRDRVDVEDYNYVFLTGGGAELLSSYFVEAWGNVEVIENPQMSNVTGYYKRAMNIKNAEEKKNKE